MREDGKLRGKVKGKTEEMECRRKGREERIRKRGKEVVEMWRRREKAR